MLFNLAICLNFQPSLRSVSLDQATKMIVLYVLCISRFLGVLLGALPLSFSTWHLECQAGCILVSNPFGQ